MIDNLSRYSATVHDYDEHGGGAGEEARGRGGGRRGRRRGGGRDDGREKGERQQSTLHFQQLVFFSIFSFGFEIWLLFEEL